MTLMILRRSTADSNPSCNSLASPAAAAAPDAPPVPLPPSAIAAVPLLPTRVVARPGVVGGGL